MSFTNVAVAGATGNLGPSILKALLAANFKVTAFTRQGSTSASSLPSHDNLSIAAVDYTSKASLVAALKEHNIDAVVCSLTDSNAQLNLIDAAVEAGVRRFLPGEFGCDSSNEKLETIPFFGNGKVPAVRRLKAIAQSGEDAMSYTLVCTGPFLDWGLKVNFFFDVAGKSVRWFDGGDRKFSVTRLSAVGESVVSVLQKPAETKNRTILVREADVTERELHAAVKKVVGGEWTEEQVKSEAVLDKAIQDMRNGADMWTWLANQILVAVYGPDYGSYFGKTDNELLGIKELSHDELEEAVREILQG